MYLLVNQVIWYHSGWRHTQCS